MNINIIEGTPAIISGEEIELKFGNETHKGKKFALCRCGHSFNGILCDGSHQNFRKNE